jgi:hypothetical protein
MFTAEELEECDLFPKKVTKTTIFKFALYGTIMLGATMLLYSFYSGRDFTSLITMEGLKYNTDNHFLNRIWKIDRNYHYNNSEKYTINLEQLQNSPEVFIKDYVSESLPLIVKDSAKHFSKLNKDNFNESMSNFTQSIELLIELRQDPNGQYFLNSNNIESLTYSNFSIISQKKDRQYNYFLNDVLIDKLRLYLNEIVKYYKFLDYLNILETMTYYSEGHDEFVVSGRMEKRENFICQLKGEMTIMLIPALFRNSVYPFRKRFGPPDYSAVNFFLAEYGRFPNFRKSNRLFINLTEGDCLFLPAFWWYSLKTFENNHYAFVRFNFSPHSRWAYEIIRGLENEEL